MIESIVKEGTDCDVVMLYSNWNEDEIAFKDDLNDLIKDNEKIKIVNILAETEDDKFIKGFITRAVIEEAVSDYMERDFFILGPPKMIESMKEIIVDLNINKERVNSESFMGY